jgi:hypothetical protein
LLNGMIEEARGFLDMLPPEMAKAVDAQERSN